MRLHEIINNVKNKLIFFFSLSLSFYTGLKSKINNMVFICVVYLYWNKKVKNEVWTKVMTELCLFLFVIVWGKMIWCNNKNASHQYYRHHFHHHHYHCQHHGHHRHHQQHHCHHCQHHRHHSHHHQQHHRQWRILGVHCVRLHPGGSKRGAKKEGQKRKARKGREKKGKKRGAKEGEKGRERKYAKEKEKREELKRK